MQYIKTNHVSSRMNERGFSDEMVMLLTRFGDSNVKGDRLVLNKKNIDVFKDYLNDLILHHQCIRKELQRR